MNLVKEVMMDTAGGADKISRGFTIGESYSSLQINEIINRTCSTKFNNYTTTGLFLQIFDTIKEYEQVNNKTIRLYKILNRL